MIGTLHETIYPARGLEMIPEFYADLDYNDDGGLIITREHEAKDPDAAAAKCLRAIAEGKVMSVGGREIAVGAKRFASIPTRRTPSPSPPPFAQPSGAGPPVPS